MKKLLSYFFIFFVLGAIPLQNCLARNDKGFSLNPFFREITLEENQAEASFLLEISNNEEMPAIFKLSVVDFGALDESGGVAFLGSSENFKYRLASWISLEKDALVVAPDEKQSVKITIKNKESLSPGGHYAAVVLRLENEENIAKQEPAKIAIDPSFASLIFVRKIGGEIYELALKNWEMNNNFFRLPSKIKLRFQNTGNVHLAPRGIVKITDPLGRVVARGIINPESALILPETFRVFPVSIQKTAISFIPGRYKVSLEHRYDGKDDFFSEERKINTVPSAAILATLTLFGLFLAFYQLKIRKKSRESIDEKQNDKK